ncbi:MAG: phage tail protein [Bacillota bacterium]|nr:phage tail protein [Bacillota bacterium]
MSKLYVARVYDETGNLLAVLENTKAAYFSRKANQATEVGFSLPRNDPKAQYLEIAHSFDLYRNGHRTTSGVITKRDFSSNPIKVSGFTNTIKLSQMQTPAKWVWDGVDLADVYRDLLLRFRWVRKNTQADFQAGERYQVDTTTEPGSVLLAKDAQYHYHASGHVTTGPIDLGTNVTRIDRLRLATREGEKVRIKAQIRTSDDNVVWSAWSTELTTNFWEEGVNLIALGLSQPHRYVDVKLNLYTDDTTTPDNEQNPSVYGFTPILDALEIVWREPSNLSAGSIPASFGKTVKSVEANFENHLAVARKLAEKYDVEFEVDGDDRLNVAEALGSDLSNSILLKRGGNINITTLSDDDSNIQNVVTCLGKGDGIGQLATILRNEASIAKYGERPGRYENKDCEDMAQLVTEGNAYLNEHAEPKQTFEAVVVGVPDNWPPFRQGDTVLVVDPSRGINQAVRIIEERRQDSEAGEKVTLGLNAELPDLATMIATIRLEQVRQRPPRPESTGPKPPGNLVAEGGIRQVTLAWVGRYDSVIIEHSLDATNWSVLETAWKGNRYVHAGLEPSGIHWYRITGVIDGRPSEVAGPTSAMTRQVGLEDLQLHSITADIYRELRNTLPYTWADSLDSNHPMVCDFYIPTELTAIVAIKLSARGLPYRAYSSAVELSDVLGTNTSAVGDHKHDLQSGFPGTGTTGYGGSSHRHYFSSGGVSGYTDTFWDNHAHNYTIPAIPNNMGYAGGHSHSVDISHGHGLRFGIYEGAMPSGVVVYCDNGAGYDGGIPLTAGPDGTLCSELDLTAKFSGAGWKKLKFTSTTLGRIAAMLIAKIDLNA